MSLEFGRRPTKKLKKFYSSVALYGFKLAFHPPLVRWKYMSSGYIPVAKLGFRGEACFRVWQAFYC